MFAQTFPAFIDEGRFAAASTYKEGPLMFFSAVALIVNIIVFVFMIYKARKTKKNPYTQEVYVGMKKYEEIKALAE